MAERDELLAEQIAYYRARAPEYDEWFLRQGIHDAGPEWNEPWLYYEADGLEERLRSLGWDAQVRETEHFILWGEARRG